MFDECFRFHFLQGLANDKELMEKLLKEHQIEIVISALGGDKILDQLSLAEAIKAAGTVKVQVHSIFLIRTLNLNYNCAACRSSTFDDKKKKKNKIN